MKAEDLAPSRLVRSAQKLSDLLAIREGASTGLVAYAGSVHLVLPPTPDKDVVVAMAQALSPEIMPMPGDSLAQAVSLAAGVLRDAGKGGSILVMADGVAPEQVALLRNAASDAVRFETTLWAAVPPSRPDSGGEPAIRSLRDGRHAGGDDADRTDVEASPHGSTGPRL